MSWSTLAKATLVKSTVPAIVLATASALAWAQPQSPPNPHPAPTAGVVESTTQLTLREALALALAGNAELAVAAREVEASKAAIEQRGARPNPELSVQFEDLNAATRTTTIQITQLVEMGGKRAARVEAAQRDGDLASADLLARRAELRGNVNAAFYAVLAAQTRVQLTADSTGLAERASDTAAKRVLAGKVSPVEETKSRVALAGVKLEALQAQGELRLARQALSAHWGNATPRFERAVSPNPEADLPGLITPEEVASRVEASPVLARAQVEVQRRQSLTAVERAKSSPDLTFNVGMKHDADQSRSQAVFGVSIPLPFFDNNRFGVQEALQREDKARDELAAAKVNQRVAALQARERLAGNLAEVKLLASDVLPGAQSAYDAAVKGFELGKFDFLDVLDAQRTLLQARSQQFRAMADAQRAQAEIHRLLGDDRPIGSPSATAPTTPVKP